MRLFITTLATPAAISSILVLLLVAFTATGAGAAVFTITSQCPCTLFPGAIPVAGGDGGTELMPGETWTITVPAGASGRIWSGNSCSFDPNTTSLGGCNTGNCYRALPSVLTGTPPATLALFTLGNGGGAPDSYGISVVEGFNILMDFSCSTCGNADAAIQCRDPRCPDANHHPGDHKYRTSQGDSDYEVVFCPST